MAARVVTAQEAIAAVRDGDTVAVSGFGFSGEPRYLLEALLDHGARDLTVVSNNAGNADNQLARLIAAGRVRKMVCSFPRQKDSWEFDARYRAGEIELELVPQGTLAERIRAQGAGIPAFYTATGVGTQLTAEREVRTFAGRDYVLEQATSIDVSLVHAHRADTAGNLVYRKTARNFGPIMAAAGRWTVVEADQVVAVGDLDPEAVVTPGIYVDAIVAVPR